MSLVCEALATKAELQELKDQLNSLLGKVASGQPINVIAQGNFEGTIIGQQLEFAENAIQDIELHDSSGNPITEVNDSVLQNIVDGFDGFVKLKGLSTYAPLGFVNNQSKASLKTLLRNKNLGKVATAGAKVSGSSIAVLSSLASIVASLGLNIATVRILGFRADQIEKGVLSWNQDYTNLINLHSKQNDSITKTNIELQKAKQIIKEQQVQIDELNNEVLQANEAISDLSNLVDSAFEQIEALKAENAALKAELEAFESEVTEDIEQLKTITTQLETDLEAAETKFDELLTTTQKLGEDMANLQGKMTELQVTINDLILQNSVNIAEINLLKKEVAQNKTLTDSKLKNLEAKLILAQHSLKSGSSGGGGFPGYAKQELVTTQMKTLELMNTLAQSPLPNNSLNIETYQLGSTNPFPDLFNQILPQIPINNLEITPLQFETIQNNIGETIADKFQEIGIETMKGDITQVKNNTTPEKQKQNVKEGVCEQTQPDKCLDKNIKQPLEEKLNQVQNNINVNILGIPNLFPDACDETLAKVTELQESLEKAWNSTTEDKKINALNNIILLHNAMLLSQDINKTIPKVQNFALQNIEVTDYLENSIDIGSEMTQTLTPFPDSISDLESTNSLQSTLVNHNQTIQSGYGAIFAVQNTKVSLLQGMATLGNYTATIGNLMQLQGSLESNSFPWMWEEFYLELATKGFIGKYAISSEIIDDVSSLAIRGLPSVEEANEAIAVNQEFVSLDAKIEQLKADYHQERDQLETTEAEASISPDIDRLDLIQLEPEEYGA